MRTSSVAGLVVVAALAAAAIPALSADGGSVADVPIPTARGVALQGTLHLPAAPNDVAVVLGSGQGYSREKLLLRRSAEALAEAGFTAVRFDWAYWTAKGEPSEGLAAEVADYDAAAAFARKQPGVKRLLVAGKSLGSLVAERWATAHAADVAGVALLTLPVNEPDKPDVPMDDENAVAKLPFEALIVCGDRDPLADRRALYRLAASLPKAPQVVVVPGDHGFQGPSKDPAETAENVELAVRALVLWARRTTSAR
jgi:predicted alpha/beta-hydrolase family hydrolase